MSYLVLARKYRPQRFSELVGQEHVARTLSNAIAANRVHHAFLFTGARGVGKTSAARILAKALVCEKGPTADPCGKCSLCVDIAAGRSVDIIEIDAASNTKVEETKSVLEGVRYLPAQARRKIYIIDEVHMLSAHSFNALLKTLEEPPPHVVFVFATTEAHKIPVTILSRCQRFDFKLIPTARLAEHLGGILKAEEIDATPEALRLVARQAAGSVRDGLSLLDQAIAYVGKEKLTAEMTAEVLGIADRRLLLDLAGAVLDRDAAAVLRLLAAAADRGVDLSELARAFLGFLRDLEVVARVSGARGSVDPGDLVDATPEELAEAKALVARAGQGLIPVLFDRWARALDEASRSQTPRLMFEMAGVDLCAAEPMLPLGDLLQRLETLEGRLSEGRLSGGGRPPAPPPRDPPPPAKGGRSWASSPATATAAPGPAVSASAAPAVSKPAAEAQAPGDVWRQVLASLEVKRPRLGALLAHAEVAAFTAGAVTLAFPEKFAADQAEKARAEVESAISEALGRPTRIGFSVGTQSAGAAVPSTVGVEAEAATADRKAREQEARQHPVIRKTQDLFGASLKEIKT